MSSSNDHIFGVVLTASLAVVAVRVVGAILVLAVATEAALAPSALIAEYWTPCEAPRPDVACWRSPSRAVVCLPLSRNEETE